MHIQELILHTRHVAAQQAFYCTTLGFSLLAETTDSFTVQAGTTRLRFQETESDVLYHVAFTIPRNTFHEAKSWVQQRVPLLHKHGEDEIFFAHLNARSFYFCDPADNILEYIVHYGLNHETEGAFGAPSVLHVSEIGLPVEDVPAFADRLHKQLAIEPYGGSSSENFAFLGDIAGQLVVVKVGRPWLPTEAVQAAVAPVQLTISGQWEQQIQLLPYPYTITVTAS
jgi:catechol 2,3-dioxygenase-like lactoylglutathione lyase family enzyme